MKIVLLTSDISLAGTQNEQEVWPPDSADTVCPRRPLMTPAQHCPRLLKLITWHDIATLTFDLGGHGACGWCGSSSSIRIPSLKFVGLAVRKKWRTMCVNISGPVDLDLWPLTFDLETGTRVTSKVGNLRSKFGHTRPLGSRIICYVCDGRTADRRANGRTKATLIAPFLRAGYNNYQTKNWDRSAGIDITKIRIEQQ